MRNIAPRPAGNQRGDLLNKMNVTLMMILLAFFIVLNTLAVPAPSKKKLALGSLIGSLGILPGGPSPIVAKRKTLTRAQAPILPKPDSPAQLMGEFEEYVIRKKIAEDVATVVTNNGLELTIDASMIFKRNSIEIKPVIYPVLDRLSHLLNRVNGPFVIECHSDNRKIKSARYATSIDFSIARAGAVARYFIDKGGVRHSNVSISGYGPLLPLFPNDTAEHRNKNNRVRIVYKRAV